ncbi:MAG: glycosyltransferase family 2 protein [Lachnospiraceae bacterium]
MEKKEVLIIIPAYNEGNNIRRTLTQLEQLNMKDCVDILVVNDASTDSTNWIVKEMNYPMLSQLFNMGYGCALQTGYKYAVRRGYQYVIQMDGDGQHDVCNIPAIYKKLKEPDSGGRCPDIVLGARFMEESADFPISLPKKIVYSMFRFLIRMTTGNKIADPTTGLQGLSRKAFLYYSKYNHFDDKYPDANMIILMMLAKFRVVEIPAVMHARTEGKSMHSGLKPFWYMLRVMYSVLIVLFRIKVLKIDAEVGLRSADKI